MRAILKDMVKAASVLRAMAIENSFRMTVANVVLKDWSDEIANQITPDLIDGKNS